jgi:hypothetical protein
VTNPYEAPAAAPAGAEWPDGEPHAWDLEDAMVRSFKAFGRAWLPLSVAGLGLTIAVQIPFIGLGAGAAVGSWAHSGGPVQVGVFVASMLAALFPLTLFTGSLHHMSLRVLRGERVSLVDAFHHGGSFFTLMLVNLIGVLVLVVGSLFCVIPGYYGYAVLSLSTFLVCDRRAGVGSSLKESARLTKPHVWKLVVLGLWAGVAQSIGVMICGVGMGPAVALSVLPVAVAYGAITGRIPQKLPDPA